MKHELTRRQFVQSSALVAGAAALPSWARSAVEVAQKVKRTAVDQVTLGNTGIRLSRLGFGAGANAGDDQTGGGKEEFIKLIHYAHDQGITYIDTAERYATFGWIGDAIKGLPREKLFIQSKVWGKPEDVLAAIDKHRKTYDTDYLDSVLIHCMTRATWTDEWKRVMDGFDAAKEKKWIRAKGVSCHTLPALRAATAAGWAEVHLVRVNPQGRYVDGATPTWGKDAPAEDVGPVMQEIKAMHAKGRGVIGMKILGNGDFTKPEDREKSIRFAMTCADIDAVVIRFKKKEEVDEAIERINRALAEA